MANNNYFDDDNVKVDKNHQNEKKKSSGKKALKIVLIILGAIIILVAVTWGVLKYAFPDFYFSQIVPDKEVADYLDTDILGRTTTTTTTEVSTTSMPEEVTYLESEDFVFSDSNRGALVGNILNGGLVNYYGGYVYHIYEGKGIYRLVPSSESYALAFSTNHNISSLNIINDCFYYVDNEDNTLTKTEINSSSMEMVAENISSAYIYSDYAYCITTNDELETVNISTGEVKKLYTARDGYSLNFVGISQDRTFFTENDDKGTAYYYTVLSDGSDVSKFHNVTYNNKIKNMSMDNGYMYYQEKQVDGTYNLVRQKFGSTKTVTLVENKKLTTSVIVVDNKVFYSVLDGSTFSMNEYNMNSNETKVMLKTNYASSNYKINIFHAGEYDFMIGEDKDGDAVYHASSNLTASSNVMAFSGSSWIY